MRFGWFALASLGALTACASGSDTRGFSVYFQPYSTELDRQGRETADAAAEYAKAYPLLPVLVVGHSARATQGHDADEVSDRRAAAIRQVLIADGVGASRIVLSAYGHADPHPMPQLAGQRVDITVGQPAAGGVSGGY